MPETTAAPTTMAANQATTRRVVSEAVTEPLKVPRAARTSWIPRAVCDEVAAEGPVEDDPVAVMEPHEGHVLDLWQQRGEEQV
jgi:hypothetical protein